jgi:uncharacterized SAM-dependent methyltransferase
MDKIVLIDEASLERRLAECLRARHMPDCFLYVGRSGPDNWLALDESSEFPVATDLGRLLDAHADRIVQHVPQGATLVSLGVGSGAKERLLLERLAPRGTVPYRPVDVSDAFVEAAAGRAADLAEATGLVALVEQLPEIRRHWQPPVLLCLLGNNFSNYQPDELIALLRDQMTGEDLLLIDAHVCPPAADRLADWKRRVEQAYRSEHNARFNLAPLTDRGLSAGDADFLLDLERIPGPDGPTWRTRKQIRLRAPARLTLGTETVSLDAGETVRLGFTFKHTPAQIAACLQRGGMTIREQFHDDAGENLLVLAGPEKAKE